MTAPGPTNVENANGPGLTARWPADAANNAQVANVHIAQWDPEHQGVYLVFGQVVPPALLTEEDGEAWLAQNPERILPVNVVGSFYMNPERTLQLTMLLARHLGFGLTAPNGEEIGAANA